MNTLLTSVISIVLVGCGASTMPPASSAASTASKQALVAQPCDRTPAEQDAGASGYPRVFIQAAQVVSGELREPLGAWLGEHAVTAPSVSSFIAMKGAPTPLSWTRCLDAACASSEPWQLTVTPTLPARASDPIVLTIRARRERDSEDQAQSTTLETRNQEPVLLDLLDGSEASPLVVVVTPYLIGNEEDLLRLAECKSSSASARGGSS
jgi:hypothetical protein